MKRENWLSCLISAVLAFGIALAGAGCLVTAFELTPVDMGAVIALCAVCAVTCSVCFCFRRGWLVLAALAAVLIGYLLREGTLERQLESLLYKISDYYDMGYGWGTVGWSGTALDAVPVTGGLALMGAVACAVVSWTVCRRKNAFFAIAVGFLPLAACLVVTDSVPEEGWLFLLLTCFGMLLLTQPVRRRDPKAAVRLTALLLVPVTLVSALLFWVNPREGYTVRMEAAQQTLLSWLDDLPFVVTTPQGDLTISVDGVAASQVDLSAIGPKTQLRYAVMDVVAQNGGLIYLRGQSLDIYDGTNWSASAASSGEDIYFPSQNMQDGGWVDIALRAAHRRMYVPYYLAGTYTFTEGRIPNEDFSRQNRRYQRLVPMDEYGDHLAVEVSAGDPIVQLCLQLPERTRQEAQQLLENAFGMQASANGLQFNRWDVETQALAIGDLVRDSAAYSLDTPRMPEEETDFALWFLQESDTGYCVHFATAAAVLLRAAGIPARYVTGYTFEARSNTRVTVRADDAHAWVEYLDPDTGWTVLDATPAAWMGEQATEPSEAQPTESDPPETQATQAPAGTEPDPTESTTLPETEPDGTTAATVPDSDASPGEKPKADLSWLWTVLEAALWTGCIVAVPAGQYWLRLKLRRRKMRTGHRNQRALALWRQARRMARLINTEPPEELEFLAEKAKFSQHTLTAAELMEFEVWIRQAENALLDKPWPLRVLLRVVFAV